MNKRKALPLLVLSLVLASCGTNTPTSDNTSNVPSEDTSLNSDINSSETTDSITSSEDSVSKAEVKTLNIDFSDKSTNSVLPTDPAKSSFTLGGITFETYQAFKLTFRDNNTDYMILRSADGAGYFNNTTAFGNRIKKVTFTTTQWSASDAKYTVYGSKDASFTNPTKLYDAVTGNGKTITVDFSKNNFPYVRFKNENPVDGKKHKNCQILSFSVEYEIGGKDVDEVTSEITKPDSSEVPSTPTPDISVDLGNQTEQCKSYYQGFNFNLSGDDLRDSLNSLLRTKRKFKNSYDDLKELSPKINCPIGKEGTIYVFYTGKLEKVGSPMSFSGAINREHVWPNSRGAGKDGLGSDPFMLQPSYVNDNSSRGNDFFTNPGEGGWTPKMNEYKGDVARLIMYGYTHYFNINHLKISDQGNDDKNNHSMGKISTLLDWHFKYPANKWELERNENGQNVIGLRNPFVDFPELAAKEFKNFNANTRAVCEKYGY